MTSSVSAHSFELPPRFSMPRFLPLLGYILFVWLLVRGFEGAEFSISQLWQGIPEMWDLLGEMVPPDLSRIESVLSALFETFQMAFIGTFIGILLSFPLASMASKATKPTPILYHSSRLMIALFRTVPDLVWALFFVATVGIGAFAGTLTLIVDTIGFCGRFFAEGMEEVDQGPSEALTAVGAGNTSILFSALVPAAFPSFINTGLFSLEKAVRSSVVLGLVGAGGIGIELKVAMDTFRFAEAATIILCIFILVIGVEKLSTYTRKKII